jgi:hypothetical protein
LLTILDILGKVGGIEGALTGLFRILFILISSNSMKVEFTKHLLLLKRREVRQYCDKNLVGN